MLKGMLYLIAEVMFLLRRKTSTSTPNEEGWRLRHTCPEGPSNDVYFRRQVTNKTEIILPSYWKGLVDWTTIAVNLTLLEHIKMS